MLQLREEMLNRWIKRSFLQLCIVQLIFFKKLRPLSSIVDGLIISEHKKRIKYLCCQIHILEGDNFLIDFTYDNFLDTNFSNYIFLFQETIPPELILDRAQQSTTGSGYGLLVSLICKYILGLDSRETALVKSSYYNFKIQWVYKPVAKQTIYLLFVTLEVLNLRIMRSCDAADEP